MSFPTAGIQSEGIPELENAKVFSMKCVDRDVGRSWAWFERKCMLRRLGLISNPGKELHHLLGLGGKFHSCPVEVQSTAEASMRPCSW